MCNNLIKIILSNVNKIVNKIIKKTEFVFLVYLFLSNYYKMFKNNL